MPIGVLSSYISALQNFPFIQVLFCNALLLGLEDDNWI